MSEKNFDKFAYFVCRASNFSIVIRPDKKKTIDGEVVFEPGLRLDFKNRMLSIEKTNDNKGILSKLREKIKEESALDPKKRAFFEEDEPKLMIPEDLVKSKLDEKNNEIEELKKENKEIEKLRKENKELLKNK